VIGACPAFSSAIRRVRRSVRGTTARRRTCPPADEDAEGLDGGNP
jgi:hypothetical protein